MKYTAIKKRVCRRVWKDKNGSEWSYMSASSAKEKNVNHRDIVGDIPSKTKGTTVGELYAQDGVHCCPIAEYHEKLKNPQGVKATKQGRRKEERKGKGGNWVPQGARGWRRTRAGPPFWQAGLWGLGTLQGKGVRRWED